MACAVVRLSPVSMTMRMPSARRASSAACVDALIGSAMAMTPAALPSTPTKIAVAPSARSSLGLAVERGRCRRPALRGRSRCRATTRLPSTVPSAPLPVGESKSAAGASMSLRALCRGNDGRCQRMLAGPLDAGGEPQEVRLVEAGGRHDGGHCRLAFGQRAGLVDDQRVDLLQPLQRFGVLDQHAGLGAAPDADHDRHRRSQAERARAGDDQHGDGGDERVREARLRPPDHPRGKRQRPRSG